MALSMDEERMLAEIERRLADDDPVLAMRLTSFRLPRLSLAPRSSRARLTASLLMLLVVAAVSVFVYALMPFRGQNGGNASTHGSSQPSHPTLSASGKSVTSASFRPGGRSSQAPSTARGTPKASGGSTGDTSK
jgi:hypothetical protein